ncbi:MAG: MFS transporter [Gammaproteobacteria bacterium]|jgi:MFS transporter, ACS family, hexuronate transporter|nr:MFS transporter [Gammaproteobacteria bacterium]
MSADIHPPAPAGNKSTWMTYENGILVLLGFTFGLIFFDRNAVGVLTPFILEDLGLSNTQLGMLSSALALAWAISAYVFSAWSDRMGARKPFILLSIIVFSLCSALSGFAGSFGFLLVARIVMGIAEGPFLPICLSVMNDESSPHRRGMNAGIMQNVFAALLGTTLAPIVLTALAIQFDWRVTFFLTGIPGLICGFLVWKFMKEPINSNKETGSDKVAASETGVEQNHQTKPSALSMLKEHNIRVCCLIAIFLVSWFLVTLTFMFVFLTNYRGFSPEEAGGVMSVMGFSTMLGGFLVPTWSDSIGRKPVMILFTFIGVITPLAALYFDGPMWMMGLLLFIGWSATGSFPLFMGVVPGETVSPMLAATSMGLVVCIGELVGGFASPWLAGMLADQGTLQAPMYYVMICAFLSGICALFLKETAPSKVG